MNPVYRIPEPFQFNPLKHHLAYIKDYTAGKISEGTKSDRKILIRELKHIGTSVMDIYTGELCLKNICDEIKEFLVTENLIERPAFLEWAGEKFNDYRIITLSDNSKWVLKYHKDEKRYIHTFPTRLSRHTFRIKANTLKSAILYYIIIGKDFITRSDLNRARSFLGLSPVKDTADAEAITSMIEILRV